MALGVGGLPRGRGGLKFTARIVRQDHADPYRVIAEMQKIGGTCAFIDAEHAPGPQIYAQKLGVNLTTC